MTSYNRPVLCVLCAKLTTGTTSEVVCNECKTKLNLIEFARELDMDTGSV